MLALNGLAWLGGGGFFINRMYLRLLPEYIASLKKMAFRSIQGCFVLVLVLFFCNKRKVWFTSYLYTIPTSKIRSIYFTVKVSGAKTQS